MTPIPVSVTPTTPKEITPVRLHWRSLTTSAVGQSADLYTEGEARRHIAVLNAAQRGQFHWWFVVEPTADGSTLCAEHVAEMDADLLAGRM